MLFFIYIKFLLFIFLLSVCGLTILRRTVTENRAKILLPTGIIIGISFFLFLVNLLAHLIRGAPLFYISLIVEALFAYTLHSRFELTQMSYPRGKEKSVWLLSLIFWGIFLVIICSDARSNGADVTAYYSYASIFQRGDFPIHAPWQPDYIAFQHTGISQYLGAARSLTGAPFYFIHNFTAFIILLSLSQILTWIIVIRSRLTSLLLLSLPVFVTIISFGNFILAWPNKLSFPQISNDIFNWLSKFPALTDAYEIYGAPGDLDGFIYFFHRLTAISFFLCLLVIFKSPSKNKILLGLIISILSSVALLDESTFLVVLPAILLVSFFIFFKRSIVALIIFCSIILAIVFFQGGIITEVILNRYNTDSETLLFPKDGPGKSEDYRSQRLIKQSSKLFPDQSNYTPFKFFHPGIIWQLSFLTLLCLFLHWQVRKKPKMKKINLQNILWLLLVSSVISLIAYHGLIPKGFQHNNGDRLLALSYHFSGLGIVLYAVSLFLQSQKKLVFKIFFFWILFFSITPPLLRLFPRLMSNWFTINPTVLSPESEWVKKYLPVKERILVLTDNLPVPSGSINLVKDVGIFTPIWGLKPRAHDVFDTSPDYADLFYTLNPESIKILSVNYLIINERYLSVLPEQRRKDLQNKKYFKLVFINPNDQTMIVKVENKYLQEGTNLTGTFLDLKKIAPVDGKYYLHEPSLTSFRNLYRPAAMVLADREIYGKDYWYMARIDFEQPTRGPSASHYDYVLLGKEIDPKSICNCNNPHPLWSGTGSGLVLWKTN